MHDFTTVTVVLKNTVILWESYSIVNIFFNSKVISFQSLVHFRRASNYFLLKVLHGTKQPIRTILGTFILKIAILNMK